MYYYLLLIDKYFEKNKETIKEAINHKHYSNGHILQQLFGKFVNTTKCKQYLKFYLYLAKKCQISVDSDAIQTAKRLCQSKSNQSNDYQICLKMIENYITRS